MKNSNPTIYGFCNLLTWLLLFAVSVIIVLHFIKSSFLCAILIIVLFFGTMFFSERVLCRYVNRVVAFFLHDDR